MRGPQNLLAAVAFDLKSRTDRQQAGIDTLAGEAFCGKLIQHRHQTCGMGGKGRPGLLVFGCDEDLNPATILLHDRTALGADQRPLAPFLRNGYGWCYHCASDEPGDSRAFSMRACQS